MGLVKSKLVSFSFEKPPLAPLCSPCWMCGGDCVPKLPFVPCLAGVLPRPQLCVWKGQQGQHGDGEEGRLCPARPPGRPEGEGAWRAVEQRKRVSGKKRRFPSSFSPSVLSSSAFFLSSSLSAVATDLITIFWVGGGARESACQPTGLTGGLWVGLILCAPIAATFLLLRFITCLILLCRESV